MSLYHEAAKVLDIAGRDGGSIKSIVFGRKEWKSDQRSLFALSTEAAKWSDVLSEVIDKSGILKTEKQLTPRLALLLTHDLLLAKKGIALPPKHGLYITIVGHKARLSAELTKVRLSRGFATLDALKAHVDRGAGRLEDGQQANFIHPRWVRINTLTHSLEEQLNSTFAAYARTHRLSDITNILSKKSLVYVDEHVPNLIAVRGDCDITHSVAYKEGKLILQEKASCFPAYLLDPNSVGGDIIDACAAPGNKTTHLAALIISHDGVVIADAAKRGIIACERDGPRSETLAKMVNLAGASGVVRIKAKQDFLRLDPQSPEFSNVTAVLLDPSCSGSGIVGRDETRINIRLPEVDAPERTDTKTRKRKRGGEKSDGRQTAQALVADGEIEEVRTQLETEISKLEARLSALSSFQLRLLERAMVFPAARRITYSTCSIHKEENEHVVVKALISDSAIKRGWRIMRREEQVEGLRKWDRRGNYDEVSEMLQNHARSVNNIGANVVSDACIRCDKVSEDGTMGFFVAGFVRDAIGAANGNAIDDTKVGGILEDDGPEDEWTGFSDDDR